MSYHAYACYQVMGESTCTVMLYTGVMKLLNTRTCICTRGSSVRKLEWHVHVQNVPYVYMTQLSFYYIYTVLMKNISN